MLRMILKVLPLLLALTAALIGVVRSEPADDTALYKLVVPTCDAPCWQGIKTDVTTRQQATAILEASPWVAQVYQTPVAITWRWSGQQPPQIDGTKDGLLQIAGSVVTPDSHPDAHPLRRNLAAAGSTGRCTPRRSRSPA